MSAPLVPPFTLGPAIAKVRAGEDLWNTRDPARVALGYTPDNRWRNRSTFVRGRPAIIEFLTGKWEDEDPPRQHQRRRHHRSRAAVPLGRPRTASGRPSRPERARPVTAMMRAVGVSRYGGPEVLELVEVPRPDTGPGRIRIRVHAATVNPGDTLLRVGDLDAVLRGGPLRPPYIPGMEAAGVVDEIGPDTATDLAVGDRGSANST